MSACSDRNEFDISAGRGGDDDGRGRQGDPKYDPEDDAAYHMSGGSLAEWFDIIIHSREATLVRFLA